ncbi:lysophospholipid acyltransferase family protein [Candidatus Villigracilis saccharophilus]|uniref:lysophospholipid acyltransferase family protein n=1 Tax=Candidatus Villigracilis saccharophilus TaxID=3140684 RepID=UPI0031368754|nr:1-acyl-sn-glycerol-3-phosphate acyltransferase [Anaerolineales bacterium]
MIHTVLRIITKIEADGYENLPKQGGFVIAVNHLGILDTPMAFYALDNWNLFIPVAEKWGEIPILKWLGKYLNLIFIDRFHPDLKSMREMINRMSEGQTLVIAPEGTRARDEKMARGKPGVAYLASKMNWQIVPVAVSGTEDRIFLGNLKRFRRTHIKLTAGKSFVLPPFPKEKREEVLQQYTDEIMCRIAVMLLEKNRGYYAEHPRLKELLSE